MLSSIYWYIFLLLLNSSLFFKVQNSFLKGLSLTCIILICMIIFKNFMPEINVHIHDKTQ